MNRVNQGWYRGVSEKKKKKREGVQEISIGMSEKKKQRWV